MGFVECQMGGIVSSLHFDPDVDPHNAVLWFLVEHQNLFEFSHWVFLALLIKSRGVALSDNIVPVVAFGNSEGDRWINKETVYFLCLGKQVVNFNALYQQIFISHIFHSEWSDRIMYFKHDEVVGFRIDILYIQIPDILKIEEKPPLKHLPFLIVEHRSWRGFLLIGAVGDAGYFLLQFYQLRLGHY